jgi:D-lactate dehydrogenase (cytochrome)
MIVKNDPELFQNYLTDASNYSGFADCVYVPESEQEVSELIKKFNVQKTRVTISANGTGLNGGRVPEGGVILSLEKLNSVLELNTEEKYIRVQPAFILKNLQELVESKGLFYPPDPTENNCFIGATVATNASGARTFKYGPTRDYVLELRIILPNGEIISINRGQQFASNYSGKITTENKNKIEFTIPDYDMPPVKNAAGYFAKPNMDLIDLFIGSEGTLGIITELKLKLIDLPKNVLSCVAFFSRDDDSMNFIDEARELSLNNSNDNLHALGLEYFDIKSLEFLRPDFPNIPQNAQAAVWFEEDFCGDEDEVVMRWIELLQKYNCDEESVWLATNKKEQEHFHVFRHSISLKVNEVMSRRGLKKVGTDIAVPVNNFRQFHLWLKSTVADANLDYVMYGHYGNCHPHLNMLPKNAEEHKKAKILYGIICDEAIKLGGTISAEHGVGKLKRDYLLKMFGESNIQNMANLKATLDPNRILNIGNMFDEKFLA